MCEGNLRAFQYRPLPVFANFLLADRERMPRVVDPKREFPGKELGRLKLDGPALRAHKIGRRTTSYRNHHRKLALAGHVHKFDAGEHAAGAAERFKV